MRFSYVSRVFIYLVSDVGECVACAPYGGALTLVPTDGAS